MSSDITFKRYLHENEENLLFRVEYYLTSERWENVEVEDYVNDVTKWSDEIKYLDDAGTGISQRIRELPQNKGGIYFFYIKGVALPFLEQYPAYIGRAKYTNNQNIRKRCLEYYNEFFKENTRINISKMFGKWGKYLHLRYITLEDNVVIDATEALLINGILPPFNDRVPVIEFKPAKPAF